MLNLPLQAKMIKEIHSKSAIHKHEKAFPVLHDLNPYRGCTIGCKYCFARYSHSYLSLNNFFKDIIVKTNIAERLDFELYKKHKNKEQIKIGGITDAYQGAEKKYKLMPDILKIFRKYKVPIFISTKSDLILRDIDLIRELAQVTSVDIAVSISCFDEKNAKIFEPGATNPKKRIELLADFSGICRSVLVLNMPIIPYISDSYEELDMIFKLSKKSKVDNIISYALHLRNENVKKNIFELVQTNFPEKFKDFSLLYQNNSSPNNEYISGLNSKINSLRKKYQIFDNYTPVMPKSKPYQLQLF